MGKTQDFVPTQVAGAEVIAGNKCLGRLRPFGEHGIIEYLSKILSTYGVEDNTNKNFTLQNGYDILSKTFSKVEKLEYIDSLAVANMDDMVDYIYSLSGMTSLNSVPKELIRDILQENTVNGVLNVPKEYGMFISM